jgi:hypothetical protein
MSTHFPGGKLNTILLVFEGNSVYALAAAS